MVIWHSVYIWYVLLLFSNPLIYVLLFLSLFSCREPDIPAWAPLLYQLQLLDIREKPDPLTLPIADRIRIGNQKREHGNFHFQREEFCLAARAYSMALDVLTTRSRGTPAINTWIYSWKIFTYCHLAEMCGRWCEIKVDTHTHSLALEKPLRHSITSISAQNDITIFKLSSSLPSA